MGGSPIALVECNPSAFLLAQFEDAITIRTAANAQADLVAMAEEIALGCIEQITQSMSKNAYIVADQNLGTAHEIPKDTPLSTIGRFCSARKSIALVETEGKVDLSLGETGIHRGLRKSYRSLINWGRKNMCMRYYNADNPDRTLFTTFLTMRKGSEVHGDYGEPVLAFLRELIESRHGELSVGFIDGGAVASTLTLWAGKTTRYNAGVYSGENKDLPLSHWSLYDAILRSLDRGDRYFSMGRMHVYDSHSLASAEGRRKMETIAFFKKGFCTELVQRSYWGVQVS